MTSLDAPAVTVTVWTPVAGAWVSVWDPTKGQGWGGLTDASGYYGFGAPDEAYTLDVQPPAGSHLVPDHETGFVVSGGTKKDVELASGNMLSGTVYAPGGTKPVAGAWVSLYNRVSGKSYGVLTDANGHYSIIAPTYSNYTLDVIPPSPYKPYHTTAFALTGDTTQNITLST